MSRVVMSLVVIGLLGGAALGGPIFTWQTVPTPGDVGGGEYPGGYLSYDLMMTVDTNIAVTELYMQSDSPAPGDFYQDALGGDEGPALDVFVEMFPNLEFDTYITLPVTGGINGAAVDIVPGVRSLTFSDQLIDVMWGVAGGAESSPGKFHVARITVKSASPVPIGGDWAIWATETGTGDPTEMQGRWEDLPEPATLLVLLGGALLGIRRRR